MIPILQIALGGALGASARYVLVQQTVRWFGTGFPLGTLAVNLLGCLLMGFAFVALGARPGIAPLLLTGLLGGFTTFSAFSLDTFALIERGEAVLALSYVGASVIGSLMACGAGLVLARMIWT